MLENNLEAISEIQHAYSDTALEKLVHSSIKKNIYKDAYHNIVSHSQAGGSLSSNH